MRDSYCKTGTFRVSNGHWRDTFFARWVSGREARIVSNLHALVPSDNVLILKSKRKLCAMRPNNGNPYEGTTNISHQHNRPLHFGGKQSNCGYSIVWELRHPKQQKLSFSCSAMLFEHVATLQFLLRNSWWPQCITTKWWTMSTYR